MANLIFRGCLIRQCDIRPDDGGVFKRIHFTSSFSNSLSYTARSAGSFMLICAGPDRIFGTKDDIIQGGGGGQ